MSTDETGSEPESVEPAPPAPNADTEPLSEEAGGERVAVDDDEEAEASVEAEEASPEADDVPTATVELPPPEPTTATPASPLSRLAASLGTGIALLLVLVLGIGIGRLGGGEAPSTESAEGEAEAEEAVWTCSMHPQIRMEEAGQCPICGMDLIPGDAGEPTADDSTATEVTLSASARALAQIRTSPVVRTEPRAEVRLLGRVDYDETRLRMITPWTDGRVDRLKVRVTGARVRKGQVVAQMYSPEVYAAMRDLVVAAKQADRLSSGMHGSAGLSAAAVGSARERLRLLGVSEGEIASIEKTRTAPKQVPIRSTFSGTVLERKVEEGDYVKAGTVLYHVADLSRVWVQIDAYESDLPHLAIGQTVLVEIDSLPDETFTGDVAFIDPVIDPETRTARVRVEVSNKDRRLRPGMFAQAVVEGDIGDKSSHLVIPVTAPLFTGRRSVVYVEDPGAPGTYALREVKLGPRAGPVYPVLSGLSEGERVVSQGAFVVDADLQLAGGRSMMTRDDDREAAPDLTVTPPMLAELQPVVSAYVEAQRALAGDDFPAARKSLEQLATHANEAELTGARAVTEAWQPLASHLTGHGRHAAQAEQEGEVRVAFEHVSTQVLAMLRSFGNPTEQTLKVAYCPMAFDNRGAQWVQGDETVANPYYGAAMLRCGDFRATVLPGERLASDLPGGTQ